MVRKILAVAVATVAVGALSATAAQGTVIKVYGTSDITDSHLFSDLMSPGYVALHPSDSINYIAQGSGAALNSAAVPANGADNVMVHAPSLEAPWVAGGHSVETYGRSLFYNDYVIVGPTADPAGILVSGNPNHDAALAFKKIAAQGTNITFLSRNDASGTNVEEQNIWCLAGSGGTYNATVHVVVSPDRCTPGASSTPSWYATPATLPFGQGANLRATNTCDPTTYPDGNCYTIVDRGTYLYEQSQGNTGNLTIVTELNSSGVPGGESLLTNPFHVYQVSTAPHPTEAAQLSGYVTSPAFQASLLNYPGFGAVAAFPDAFPQPTALTFPSQSSCVTSGSSQSIGGTLVYPPPVAVNIQGIGVTLKSSTTSGGPYSTTVASTTTNGSGVFGFTVNPTVDTYYQITTPDFTDSNTASIYTASSFTGFGNVNHNGFVDVC